VAAARFSRLLDDLRVDLVHSFLYRANVLARLGARFARHRPIVLSGHHSLSPLLDPRGPLAARWTRHLSDVAVVVSRAVREEVMRSERVRPDRIVVLENGVDTQHFDIMDRDTARAQLGLDAQAIIVGAVGRLSEEKGYHHLLDSVARARQRGVNLDLVLAGEGPERGRLEKQAQALGLDGHVKFLGVLRDVRPVYAAIDIFALTSREEASPTVLLEAMACGRAAVATRVGGVLEMVEHERTGLLVEPGEPSRFADALVRLAQDSVLRSELSDAARLRVREQFDISRMIHKHGELYSDLLSQRTSA
jgi:glycosyltransferase involved in cell wall biosynthesis